MVGLGPNASVLDGFAEGVGGDAAVDGGVRSDGQLGVPHLLAGQLLGYLVGERPHVLRIANEVDD